MNRFFFVRGPMLPMTAALRPLFGGCEVHGRFMLILFHRPFDNVQRLFQYPPKRAPDFQLRYVWYVVDER